MTAPQDMQHCAFCYTARPAFCLPLEHFQLQAPGTAQSIWNDQDWPLCEGCEPLVTRRYFRSLAERCAEIRTATYRAEGEQPIAREESLRFFLLFLSDISRHIDTTRDIYPNPWLEEAGDA